MGHVFGEAVEVFGSESFYALVDLGEFGVFVLQEVDQFLYLSVQVALVGSCNVGVDITQSLDRLVVYLGL